MSADLDVAIGYVGVKFVMRPCKGSMLDFVTTSNISDLFQFTSRQIMCDKLGVSSEALQALAIVSRNDYSANVPTIGTTSSLDIIKRWCKSEALNTSAKTKVPPKTRQIVRSVFPKH